MALALPREEVCSNTNVYVTVRPSRMIVMIVSEPELEGWPCADDVAFGCTDASGLDNELCSLWPLNHHSLPI